MITFVILLLLIGFAILLWSKLREASAPPEIDLDLHHVRRRLDVTLTRSEIKRDAMRLRRELDNELKDLP